MAGEGDTLQLVNQLLERSGKVERISKLEDCNCELVYSLYSELFNGQVSTKPTDEASSYQLIINGLSEILPREISLSHISGINIANGDALSLRNLLQILHEMFIIKNTEQSDDNNTILQYTSNSSSLCTDDTQALLQVNAISRRVAIAKKELSSSSSSGTASKYGSHDIMRTPSPRRHSSSFTPLLMSTPHPTAKSRLGVANIGGVAEEVESISSINSEVGVVTTEMIPSLTITTMSSSDQPLDTTESYDVAHGSHDTTDGSHDTSDGSHDTTDRSHDTTDRVHDTDESSYSSDAVTIETDNDDTVVQESTDLKQCGVEKGVLESHDVKKDGNTAEENTHDPDRSVILDKIYQKYVKDRKLLTATVKMHRTRKSKLKMHKPPYTQQPQPPTDDLMSVVKGEFPFLQLSPSMAHRLWHKQLQQVKQLSHPMTSGNPTKKVREAEERQRALLGIIRKELTLQQRMEEKRHRQLQQQMVKARLHSHKMATVHTKKYYRDYELRLKAKMQRKRTREEQVFRRALEEGLELQKNRIREVQRFAKEKFSEEVKKHAEQLESMENYYRDQFMLLAEEIANEKAEKEIRGHAQQQLVERMKRELRQKMEKEIQSLQECIDREDDEVHFRQLDAEQFLSHKLQRLKLATHI